jgi:hypothetical protein
MIDLKQVAELARQDAEDRAYVTKVFKNVPEGDTLRRLAENSIRIMEETTSELAKLAAADDTNTTH